MSIYLELTRQFNAGGLRAILAGGQAVVLHGLAMMSKDGDWIVRENNEACSHILKVLQDRGARYRFGAPFDPRWLAGGWSAHLEFMFEGIRVRTDFVTRPPRLDDAALAALWAQAGESEVPFAGPLELAEMKKTNREKDYAVIAELARLMERPEDQLLYSRSARDLLDVAEAHPELAASIAEKRPSLRALNLGRDAMEAALDAERRSLMRSNERRLEAYMSAAERWAEAWPVVARLMEGLPLLEAHRLMVERAEDLLPLSLGDAP